MGEVDLSFINDVNILPKVPYIIFFVLDSNLQNGKMEKNLQNCG